MPSWVSAANDEGAVAAGTRLRLTFVLTRSAERQAAFEQLLADQQNPASPSYHQWLTPLQVGERYGPTEHDVAALTAWLVGQGFTLTELAPSRVFLTAEASAASVTAALATPLRNYRLHGEARLATTAEPALPVALAPLVGSITGLAATPILPQSQGFGMKLPVASATSAAPGTEQSATPQFTTSSGLHYLTPNDFATIFDINPVYNAGYTGTGQKVAIVGRSRVVNTDVSQYEGNVGLATNLPNVVIPTTGVDPGVSYGDEGEALLDVDRILGTAPGVQADLVVSASTGGYDGIYIAAQYEVQTLRDPVMNISFGSCEAYAGASGVSMWDTLFAQAASEGISVFVSSGDSGAGFCNTQFATPDAYQFRSVNSICASSYATCAGGTELADAANPSQYWSATNSAGRSSALSYIPEGAWNDPAVTNNAGGTTYLAQGTGGGASIYFPKPAWQAGTGVPADGARDLPDVSFPASGHDGYYLCRADGGGNCANGYFYYSYGTSAAAPGMAGVTALLNQKAGGAQGNLNPLLYRLAATPGVFHDATPASSGVANCDVGTPSLCNNSDPSPTGLTGGLAGFALTTGYDQATGNGSLDVSNFLTAATASAVTAKAATTLAVTGGVTSVAAGGSATFTAAISSAITGTPTGTVQFYVGIASTGPAIPVSGGKAAAAITFPSAGSQLVSAVYSGDGTYASAIAPGIAFPVVGLGSRTTLSAGALTATTTTPVTLTATVTSTSSGTAVPTGLVRFYDSYSGYFNAVPLVNGVATFSQAFPGIGNHGLSAYYLGDAVYGRSSGTAPTFTVTVGTPVLTWATPASITYGTPLSASQLNAATTVNGLYVYTPAAGAVLNAGTQTLAVKFSPVDSLDYHTSSATVSLTVMPAPLTVSAASVTRTYGAGNPAFSGSLTGIVNNDGITASYSSPAIASSPAGTYPITAMLADPGNRLPNYAVTNNAGTLTVAKAATATTLNAPSAAITGASVTLSATVTSVAGTPTGNVAFSVGTNALGMAALNGAGVGTLTLTTLPAGSDNVTATYGSDPNFAASASAASTIVVAAPDYTASASPAYGTVNAGQSAAFMLTVTPVNGFNQPVTFAVTGLPAYASASFNPGTVTPAGAAAGATLTIATDVHAALELPRPPGFFRRAAGTLAFAFLLLPFVRRRRRLGGLGALVAFACGVLLLSAAGCGGGASGTAAAKTPDGTYTITVTTTSGAIAHTAALSLTVAN